MAQTVLFDLGKILGVGQRTKVTFTPTDTPVIVGAALVLTGKQQAVTDNFGVGNIDLVAGVYTVTFGLQNNADSISITVPAGSGTVNLFDIIDGGAISLYPVGSSSVNVGPILGITGFVGGTNKLDGVVTVNQANTLWWIVDPTYAPSGCLMFLQPGAQTVSDPANRLVVPLDHATSGNVFVAATA